MRPQRSKVHALLLALIADVTTAVPTRGQEPPRSELINGRIQKRANGAVTGTHLYDEFYRQGAFQGPSGAIDGGVQPAASGRAADRCRL
jgi:hypothetical protein